jgi:RNase H-like domain found in reverse transcriptase
MEPLRDLNKDSTDWVRLPQHQAAFEEARQCLSGPSHFTFFDPSRATELLTDASRIHGLRFLLQQRCEDGQWCTVQCGSRTLAKHEANWLGMAELKALAVAWAAKKCSFFLDGLQHFEVVTNLILLAPILNKDRRLDQICR